MIRFVERPGKLEVSSPVRPGTRCVFGALALFPLVAPYELLVRIRWETYWHPFFALAAIISVGAIALSGLLVYASVAALSSTLILDAGDSAFTYSAIAPLVAFQPVTRAFSDITGIDVVKTEWTDGSPTYRIAISCADGAKYETASVLDPAEAESGRARISEFITRSPSAAGARRGEPGVT